MLFLLQQAKWCKRPILDIGEGGTGSITNTFLVIRENLKTSLSTKYCCHLSFPLYSFFLGFSWQEHSFLLWKPFWFLFLQTLDWKHGNTLYVLQPLLQAVLLGKSPTELKESYLLSKPPLWHIPTPLTPVPGFFGCCECPMCTAVNIL